MKISRIATSALAALALVGQSSWAQTPPPTPGAGVATGAAVGGIAPEVIVLGVVVVAGVVATASGSTGTTGTTGTQ